MGLLPVDIDWHVNDGGGGVCWPVHVSKAVNLLVDALVGTETVLWRRRIRGGHDGVPLVASRVKLPSCSMRSKCHWRCSSTSLH